MKKKRIGLIEAWVHVSVVHIQQLTPTECFGVIAIWHHSATALHCTALQ